MRKSLSGGQQPGGSQAAKEKKAAQEAASKKRKGDLDTDTEEQLGKIDVSTKTWVKDDPATTVDERKAAGSFCRGFGAKRTRCDMVRT